MLPKIAIIYLSYHCDPYLDDAAAAWRRLTYPRDRLGIVIVDNPHPEYGPSARRLMEEILPFSGKEIPEVKILLEEKNLGYAGGNNTGIRWALAHGYDYIFLHNQDGFLAADALEPLVRALETDRGIGLAQPLIFLHPETDCVNTSGNRYHYLGFGFCGDYRVHERDLRFFPVQTIPYASGAAVLIRADLLEKLGALDEDFFLYHEDLELSFRLRFAGYRSVVVSASRFYHKYSFGRSMEKFFWMERNRFAILFLFFRLPTLLLLAPMFIAMEAGLLIFALRSGLVSKRLAVYRYWMSPSSRVLWRRKRAAMQSLRTIPDRTLLRLADTSVRFQEKSMENPLLLYLGNPLMTLYYWAVLRTIVWW